MGIVNIPNQPIHFEVPEYDTCIEQDLVRCAQFGQADGLISTQFRLEPCGSFMDDLIYAVPECWEIVDSAYSHTCDGTSRLVISTGAPLNSYGNYVRYEVDVNVYTGSITLELCGTLLSISQSGGYSFYANVNCAPAELNVIPTGNFIGDIIILSASYYYLPPAAASWVTIYDYKNQQYNTLCSNPISQSIYNDTVTISVDASCFEAGCYSLQICNPCEINSIAWEYQFTFSQSSPDEWIYDDDCAYMGCVPISNVSFGTPFLSIESTASSGTFSENSFKLKNEYTQQQPDCCYIIQIKFGAITSSGIVAQSYFEFKSSKESVCSSTIINPDSNSVHEFICCDPITTLYFRHTIQNNDDTTTWNINSISIRPVNSCQSGLHCYTTNCFQILPYNQLQGTRLVTGQSKTGTYQLGFYWNGTFKLKQRLKLAVFAPTYDITAPTYVFSDGTKSITSAQREKIYEVAFSDMDENQHDTLSTQILTKLFKIDTTEYVVSPNDYKPEWNKSSGYPRADVRMQAMKQGTIIFRSNEN